MEPDTIRNLTDRLKRASASDRAAMSAAARAAAATPAARFLRFAVGARVRDLVSGVDGAIVSANRDASTRWEVYGVKLDDARQVFRADRELEALARVSVALIFFFVAAVAANGQAVATLAFFFDEPIANMSAYTLAAFVDGVATTAPPTCVGRPGDPTKSDCTAPTAPIGPGKHTLRVSATKNGQTATTELTNFDPANGPKNASTPTYVLTVTIKLP